MSWLVIHEQADQQYDLQKTKKAATAAAKEMQDAHEKIGARHNGEPVTFRVDKTDQEPAETPGEEE